MPQLHDSGLNFYAQFTYVRRKLSEISAGFWTDLEIYNELNLGQLYIQRKSKILKRRQSITTVVSTREYDLKDNDFPDIMDIDEDGVQFNRSGTNIQHLDYKTKSQLRQENPGWRNVDDSTPQEYYYDKATKTIGLQPKPNAANVGAYLFVIGTHKPKVLNAGNAVSGSTTEIVLATGSDTVPFPSATDDYYNDIFIEIYSGTGAGQKAKITDYVASTRTCTATFATAPDNTSRYGMMPQIPEEAQYLMQIYAISKLVEKGGSRSTLSDRYWRQFTDGLFLFMGETIEEDDETTMRESYRA